MQIERYYSHEVLSMLDHWLAMAREMQTMDGFGALHLVVEDGNITDDDIEFCLSDENSSSKPITGAERDFALRLLQFQEGQRGAIWELAQLPEDHIRETPNADRTDPLPPQSRLQRLAD